MHRNFTTVSQRVARFSQKMFRNKKGQNLHSAVKYSLFSAWLVNYYTVRHKKHTKIFFIITSTILDRF